jgi:hypothetical protein
VRHGERQRRHPSHRGLDPSAIRRLELDARDAGDWNTFAADFVPGACLYPAARPAKRQTPEDFIERMKGVAATSLRSFKEAALGSRIRVFGNVAVAVRLAK